MAAQKRFPRELAALPDVFAFLEDFLGGMKDGAGLFNISLVIEELFTNMVRHARNGRHEIEMALAIEEGDLVVKLTDFDVEPWDPTAAPPFDSTQPLESRSTGGMGLHLVRQLARSLTYDHRDGRSITTVRMRLSDEFQDRSR